eukprot:3051334-Rhodomonas_salina.2
MPSFRKVSTAQYALSVSDIQVQIVSSTPRSTVGGSAQYDKSGPDICIARATEAKLAAYSKPRTMSGYASTDTGLDSSA